MVSSQAASVAEYLASLAEDRRKSLGIVRKLILKHLPKGYQEGIQYGMISYFVPLSIKPDTYNGQALAVASLASQKAHMSLYLMGLYIQPKLKAWFEKEYKKSGLKMDMGKSCIRFKSTDELQLELIAQVIASTSLEKFIEMHDRVHKSPKGKSKA